MRPATIEAIQMYYLLKPLLQGSVFIAIVAIGFGILAATAITLEVYNPPKPVGNCYDPPHGCQ